jgi:hypothetical protein
MFVVEHIVPFGDEHSRAAFCIEWHRLTGEVFPGELLRYWREF